jgi:hypothetical protein
MRFFRFAVIGKAMYGGLLQKYVLYGTGAKISCLAHPICLSRLHTSKMPSHLGGGACIFMIVWWRRGYGRISCGTRVLELAAGSREATVGYGACSTSTNLLEPAEMGQHDTRSEKYCRDGRSDEV